MPEQRPEVESRALWEIPNNPTLCDRLLIRLEECVSSSGGKHQTENISDVKVLCDKEENLVSAEHHCEAYWLAKSSGS